MDPARLAKASLTNTVTGQRLPVMYNPEELRLDQGNAFAEVPVPGLGAAPVQFVRGRTRTLSMDLFFDTYETGEDVRAHTSQLVALLVVDRRTKAPPVLVFAMGRLTFECVLVEANQRFTMFRRDGTPVRSTVAVRLQEFTRVEFEIEQGFFVGPPTVQSAVHTVARGETAAAVAQAVLGDPARWRELAIANELDDPFDLLPGRALVVPGGGAVIAEAYAPAFEVRISGITLAAELTEQVVSLSYDNNLDLADMFTLVLRNPDNRLLDSAVFDLGRTVEIHMGYASELEPMMLGEITAIEPSFPEGGAPTIRVTGYDRSHRMRTGQGERQFQWVPDSVIAAQVAVEAGLVPIVDPSPIFHRKKITQSGSDMAFLKERARANFFDVFVRWDKLYFQFPRPQTEAIVLEWGRNLSSYEPRISAAGVTGIQVVRGYSEELAQSIVALATGLDLLDFDAENLLERLGGAAADLLLSFGRSVARTHHVESPLDATVLAQSLLKELLEGMYEGRGSCLGMPSLRAGSMIEVRGVGRRFSGIYRLRRVTHTIGEGGYRTSFEVTQRAGGALLSLLRRGLQDTPSPHRREPFVGVAVAKVEANRFDPADGPPMAKVKVSYPWLSDKVESGWARCASPMTGRNAGLYLLPSVGDEVLVAFEHGDLSRPVIIGGLWNGPHAPPATNLDGHNAVRMLRTPGGHTITLDDTPTAGGVTVAAKGGAQIVLKGDGSVSITAATTLALKAEALSIDAKSVDVKVVNTMNVHG